MLRIRDLAVRYGDAVVLDGVDLDLAQGQFVSLVGPSGSGKTSILRVVTELLEPLRGTVELEAGVRDVGFLFQDDALLPWRTVRQNVALGLRIRKVSASDVAVRVNEWLGRVGLAGFEDRYPAQLSGGQRKRAALAQILVLEPRLLLMDEPFASLDAIVRFRITQELMDWVEREHMTVLLVTHDLEEAISVSDSVYVLDHGPRANIVARYQVDIPRPRQLFKARQHPSFAPLLERLWMKLSGERVSERAER